MLTTLAQSSRLPFLILTPACVLVGIAMAEKAAVALDISSIALILIAAIAAHISVNALNEYEDFKTGLDLKTKRTPFSGGSGALPANPEAASSVLGLGIVTLLIAIVIGLYFTLQVGWLALAIGIPGCLLIITYTRWVNRAPTLCLLSPGLAFGPMMIIGTFLVLTGSINTAIIWASLPAFFLVNNLLLLNQYPDIAADKSIGRNHYPIRYGINTSNQAYLLFLLATVASLLLAVWLKQLPLLALISIVALIPAFICFTAMRKLGEGIAQAPQFMAMNVITAITHPLLLSAGIYFGEQPYTFL